MNRRTLLGAVGSASLVGLAGCQELAEDLLEEGELPDPEEVLGDGELTLETTTAKPGNTVEISGPIEELGEEPVGWLYDATVEEPGEDDRHPVFVDVEESHLVVPVHPADYMGGGPAEIEIRDEDDEVVLSGVEFEVEPLDPAPGTLSGMIDDLEAALVEAAETLGYSADELRAADLDDMESLISGIAAGLQAFEGGGAGVARSLLDGDDEILDDGQHDEDVLEVVDALAHETGFADDVLAATQPFAEMDDLQPDSGQSSLGAGGSMGSSRAGRPNLGSPRTASVGSDMGSPRERMKTVEDLERFMDLQSRYANANEGAAAAARDGGAVIIAGVAFVPGGQAAAGVGAATLTLMDFMIQFYAEELPSKLEIDVSAEPKVYQEDEDDEGELSGAVEGHSEGFTFSWPDAVGGIPGLGAASRVVRRAPTQSAQNYNEALIEWLQQQLTMIWGELEQRGAIDLDPKVYGPFDIDLDTDDEFLEAREEVLDWETDNQPFAFNEDDWTYVPRAVGRSLLTVRARDGAFGDASGSDFVEIEVEPIEVIIREASMDTSGDIYRLDPEEDTLIEFYAEIEGANDEEVEWDFERISGPAVPWPDPWGPDNNQIAFDISGVDFPEDDRGEYVFEAESATRDGLRADGEPPRTDRVTVLVTDEEEEDDLVVEPNPGCLELDDSHQLTARSGGQEIGFDELTWRIEGEGDGDITPDGVFVPSAEGDVFLEFWLEDDRDVTSEMQFWVREECTELRIRVDGREEVYSCVAALPVSEYGGGAGADFSIIMTQEMRWDTPPDSEWRGDPVEVRLGFYAGISDQPEGDPMEYSGFLVLDNVNDDASASGKIDWWEVPVRITREVEPGAAHDGSDLDVFEGEFGPSSEVSWIERLTVEGEFYGVASGEDGCGNVMTEFGGDMPDDDWSP